MAMPAAQAALLGCSRRAVLGGLLAPPHAECLGPSSVKELGRGTGTAGGRAARPGLGVEPFGQGELVGLGGLAWRGRVGHSGGES